MSAATLFDVDTAPTAEEVESGARRAYAAAMTMRGAGVPFEPWESLPEYWRRLYRVQARAVLTNPEPPISETGAGV